MLAEVFSQWMVGKGPDSDIVVSSRVRLARNLSEIPFPHRLSEEQAKGMISQIHETVDGFPREYGMSFHYLRDVAPLQRKVLVEKHLISPAFIQEPIKYQAVAIDQKETISIMLNEEDHIRIQVLLPALQLYEAWNVVNQIDDLLESQIDFAFDAEFGYLTACPTNLGTAMRASVMLHLPALVLTRQASQVFTTLAQIGMVVRGLYGEGSEAFGNLFQVSNQVSLGLSEEEFMHNLSVVVQQIVGRERHAREHLLQNAGLELKDRIGRAWGLLTHAKIMSSEEALRLISEVKLGQDLGLVKLPPTVSFGQLTTMTQPGFLQVSANEELEPTERDVLRSQMLQKYLLG